MRITADQRLWKFFRSRSSSARSPRERIDGVPAMEPRMDILGALCCTESRVLLSRKEGHDLVSDEEDPFGVGYSVTPAVENIVTAFAQAQTQLAAVMATSGFSLTSNSITRFLPSQHELGMAASALALQAQTATSLIAAVMPSEHEMSVAATAIADFQKQLTNKLKAFKDNGPTSPKTSNGPRLDWKRHSNEHLPWGSLDGPPTCIWVCSILFTSRKWKHVLMPTGTWSDGTKSMIPIRTV
jgi:hypothetical protein